MQTSVMSNFANAFVLTQITECPSAQEPIRTRSRLRVHRCLDPHRASAAIICKRHPLDSISTSR